MIQSTNTIQALASDKYLTRTLFNNFSKVLVMIFHAQWNESSQHFLKQLYESIPFFGQHTNVQYFTIYAYKCPEIFKKFTIYTTPTIIFTQTNKRILYSTTTTDIGNLFDQLSLTASYHKQQFYKDQQIWHPRIESILKSCPIIVFIKGTPDNPKCGFTYTLLNILKTHEIEYAHYDIIADYNMRYWLRHYSGWPTYPQLYIDGKIVGGLDIVKYLVAKNYFIAKIPIASRRLSIEEKYTKLIQSHLIVAFIDGFGFENKETETFLKIVYNKHGTNSCYVCNIAIDSRFKTYLQNSIANKLPFLVVNGTITPIE